MNAEKIIEDLIQRPEEEDWFEFKENWFEKEVIGHYISALSNAAAFAGKDYGYMVWGINDKTHAIVGTDIDFYSNHKGEPLQNYLARNLYPSIAFTFEEILYPEGRVVLLAIPAANKVPVSFDRVRYGRIGSSFIDLARYPEREGLLWYVFLHGYPTMINTESPLQNLTFSQLKRYYESNGLLFNDDLFKVNLHLLTDGDKYNMLACYLADNGEIPVRVALFTGKDKASKLYSVKEFGNESLVSVIDRIISYSISINMPKAYENLKTGHREDTPLFDQDCFNEAVKNAFIHNSWLRRVSPMITFFDDRVEITSFSSLAPKQTMEGFYTGRSVPVNEELSAIYLATHLSERTGKGNPLIVSTYGREAFQIGENYITVTLPYNYKRRYEEIETRPNVPLLNKSEQRIFEIIQADPYLSQATIMEVCEYSQSTVEKAIRKLKANGYIQREGSDKSGHWKILVESKKD